jgi:hypothetical protein
MLASSTVLVSCDGKTKTQLATLAHADSIRVDSLAATRAELLSDAMASTQFIADINTELAKARSLSKTPARLQTGSEETEANAQRRQVVARISQLVSALDSVQARVKTLSARSQRLAAQDKELLAQVATYQQNIADLRQSAEQQKADLQAVIDQQARQIASLNQRVDTLTTERVALADTVGQLTTEKNAAYYVIGTRDELIRQGILVENGPRHFVLFGSRPLAPARDLDPSKFTRIDRLATRTIDLPAGDYEIISRQSSAYATPKLQKDGKIEGGLTIAEPEQFWAASRFLILVKS